MQERSKSSRPLNIEFENITQGWERLICDPLRSRICDHLLLSEKKYEQNIKMLEDLEEDETHGKVPHKSVKI